MCHVFNDVKLRNEVLQNLLETFENIRVKDDKMFAENLQNKHFQGRIRKIA